MQRVLLAALAALGVTACAEDYYGPYGGGGAAYYDGFYGPYYDGYWGPDGAFWYRGGHGRPYVRDDSHHFRHDPGGGGQGVRAHPGFHGWSRDRGGHGGQPRGDRGGRGDHAGHGSRGDHGGHDRSRGGPGRPGPVRPDQ